MKYLAKMALLLSLSISATFALAGTETGNGGDHVRGTFLRLGRAVVSYLKDTQEGATILKQNRLSVADLEGVLTIDRIKVALTPLVDNGGSRVDALYQGGRIVLNGPKWFEHFEQERDVYYLTFHEMLRAIGRDDDNYVISKSIERFPVSRRVATRLMPLIPLLKEDSVAKSFDTAHAVFNGTGCQAGIDSTAIEVDLEKNTLEASFSRYSALLAGQGIARSNCGIALPIRVPRNKRLVITQIDLTGSVDLKIGSSAQVRFEAFLAGTQGETRTKTIAAQGSSKQGRFLMRETEVLKTACGGSGSDAIVRLNTSARVDRKASGGNDRLDISRASVYFKIENCQ